MMGSSRLFPAWIILLCLNSAPMKAAAPAKDELPQGYENAVQAEGKAPAPKAAQAAKPRSAVDAIGEALKRRHPEKVKLEEPPQGYEDAAEAETTAAGRAGNATPRSAIDAVGKALERVLPANVDPQVAQLEQQFRPQFQQMLHSELAFIRRACNTDQAQRETVATAGQRCMSAVLRQCAVAQVEMMQRPRPSRSVPNAGKLLRDQLAEIVNKSLRAEQIERYRRESEQRSASRKQAVVRYMVARADQTLVLSIDQRAKLVLALTENYSDAWEQSLAVWMNNVQFMPSMPDAQIVPLLNEEQRIVWREIQKLGDLQVQMHWMMLPGMAVIQEEQ